MYMGSVAFMKMLENGVGSAGFERVMPACNVLPVLATVMSLCRLSSPPATLRPS
jgi:hypothetical protein